MSETQKKFYLTTPIYYVNARPHIGHAYTTIVADVLARRHRLLGDDTFFLTGTDEHGQKIERSAAAAGVPPQQFADQVSKTFEDLWKRMGITNDAYIRTTDEKHKRGVQKLFADLYERGYIYLDSYTGQYSIGEEMFVEASGGTIGPDGKPTETVTEENFFFKLSAFEQPLIAKIESGELKVEPESRRNEVLSFLRGGLKDLSISRSSFTWGIPVPEPAASAAAQKHVIYVWLDALANYMTAIGYGSDEPADVVQFDKYWPADLHLVGKEIIRFHCVYWPAFLMAAGLPLPKAITAHGWLLFDNSKMSKSKGNIVRTETILDGFGDHVYGKQFPESTKAERDLFASDVLRYFLLREIPFGQDGSFSFEAMWARYDSELGSKYGNLVSRVSSLVHSKLGRVPDFDSAYRDFSSRENPFQLGSLTFTSAAINHINQHIEHRDFAGFLAIVLERIGWANNILAVGKPWADEQPPRYGREIVLYVGLEALRIITALLYPILPFSTATVWSQLGLGDIEEAARTGKLENLKWGELKPGRPLGPSPRLSPRRQRTRTNHERHGKPTHNRQPRTDNRNPPRSPAQVRRNPNPAQPVTDDPTHPAAGPRTSALEDPTAGSHVGGSAAITTERPEAVSHTEATASGAFASVASQTPISAEPDDAAPQISIDDFAKIELRVAEIKVAERIPKADKLLRLEVDLGYERRQILSGIAEWYAPEDLVGRRIVVITNLAPRKMRGLESHGMLLAASHGDNGKPVLATFGEDIALGSRLK